MGDAVSLRAAGFTPNTALRVMYNGYSLGLALPSDADGRLMLSCSLPPGVAPGVHVLGLDDGNGNIAYHRVHSLTGLRRYGWPIAM